jgi:hypothetical protein
MPLSTCWWTRHAMSLTVRNEVSPKSHEWGYQLGSVYIRKVHFRDEGDDRQIEEKVVNRLRQVTSAIKQDGANQVSIIVHRRAPGGEGNHFGDPGHSLLETGRQRPRCHPERFPGATGRRRPVLPC